MQSVQLTEVKENHGNKTC